MTLPAPSTCYPFAAAAAADAFSTLLPLSAVINFVQPTWSTSPPSHPFIPSASPAVPDVLISQHCELASFLVLLLWSQTPIKALLKVWSTHDGGGHLPFRNFVECLLTSTKVSSLVVVLALKYLSRLADVRDRLDPMCRLNGPDSHHIALLVCLVLANKFADDERFTNAAWAKVANIDITVLNAVELEALFAMDFNLQVDETEYTDWVARLSLFATRTASAYEREAFNRTRDLHSQSQTQVTVDQPCRSLPTPYVPSMSSAAATASGILPVSCPSICPLPTPSHSVLANATVSQPFHVAAPPPPPAFHTSTNHLPASWISNVAKHVSGWSGSIIGGGVHGAGQMVMGH